MEFVLEPTLGLGGLQGVSLYRFWILLRRRDGAGETHTEQKKDQTSWDKGFVTHFTLAKFAMWQFRLLSDGGNEVLRASTLREMQRVQWGDSDWKTTWGLGFFVRQGDPADENSAGTFVGHGGSCPGYTTHFRLEPKSKIAVIVLHNFIDSESVGPPWLHTAKAFDLVRPAIEKALEDPDGAPERDPALDRYTGVYDSLWGQSAIVRWEDGLAELLLTTHAPKEALTRLKRTGEHTFRRIREDDEELGERIVFDIAEDGTVSRYRCASNWYVKVR